jgi:hypothetical protein
MADTSYSKFSHTNGPVIKLYDLGTNGPYGEASPLVGWDPVGTQWVQVKVDSAGQLFTTGTATLSTTPVSLKSFRSLTVTNAGVAISTATGAIWGWTMSHMAPGFGNPLNNQVFVKLYDKATVPLTTDTPILTIPVLNGIPAVQSLASGLKLNNGLGIRATTGIPDADNTAPPANQLIVNVYYV